MPSPRLPDPRDVAPGLFTPVLACWICGSARLDPVLAERLILGSLLDDPALGPILRPYDGLDFALNRCGECGFIQPAVLPAADGYFEAIYDLAWSQEAMEAEVASAYKDFIFKTILAELGRRTVAGRRRLLDIGTHVGRMLVLAREAGWTPVGIDLNPQTVAFARARTGLDVRRTNAKDLVAMGDLFDAVVLTDVLEHIPDPLAALAQARALLEPGGWIAVKVPCGANQSRKQRLRHRMCARHDPGIATNFVHVNHFGPRSLALALGRSGFDAIEVGVGAPELPQVRGAMGAAVRGCRRAVYAAARLVPFGVHSPLALNLQAYARNPVV